MIGFHKFEALGNDFLIVREEDLAGVTLARERFTAWLCDRRFGVGADGVEILLAGSAPEGADFAIRLHNADGGETPISGNGMRCVGAWLYLVAGWDRPSVRLATGAGIRELFPVDSDHSTGRIVFRTAMGVPQLSPSQIPVLLPRPTEQVVDQALDLGGTEVRFTATSMGNPHCTIFVENFEGFDWRWLGAQIEVDPRFPERTNVEFVRVIDRQSIEVRFWERGCGETLASGTGACAAVVAAVLNRRTERMVRVSTAAGELLVEWSDDGSVWQTGEARYVYRGEWPSPSPTRGRPAGAETRRLR